MLKINKKLSPKNIQKDLSFKDDLNSKCLKNKNSDGNLETIFLIQIWLVFLKKTN